MDESLAAGDEAYGVCGRLLFPPRGVRGGRSLSDSSHDAFSHSRCIPSRVRVPGIPKPAALVSLALSPLW